MKLRLMSLLALSLFACQSFAAEIKTGDTLNLWQGQAPGQQGDTEKDIPAITVYKPESPTGASIVVCPGGGYGVLAPHEGKPVAEWLNKQGITAFVLRYRLGPKYHHPVELGDAQRAIRYVRSHAQEWKLDPRRIGILGFSAGGHLTSSAATHFDAGDPNAQDPIDRVSCRPDLQILIYPVVTMGPTGHAGSMKNLLGNNPDPKLIELMSNEKQVTKDTPPAFVIHTVEDKAVPVSNSDNYVEALKKAGVEVEYLRPEKGQHGFGLRKDWTDACEKWLKKHDWSTGTEGK